MPYCQICGSLINEYDSGYYARNMLCIPCYVKKTSEVESVSCARCGTRVRKYESKEKDGQKYCNYCFNELSREEKLPECAICSRRIEAWQKSEKLSDGKIVHSDCLRQKKEETEKILRGEKEWSDRDERGGGTLLGAAMNRIISILP